MKAVLLGATRGMGRALAREMAERGERLFLLGRAAGDLERSAADLQLRGAGEVGHALCDLLEPKGFAPALERAAEELGHFDTVVISAGLFARQEELEADAELANRLIERMLRDVDLAYAQEWKFDHGVMVPLHFLTPAYDVPVIPININCQGPPITPLHRAYEFGRTLRKACDAVDERIAVVGTGGLSHWPATPDSGKINETWDRTFLDRWLANDREALTSYSDEATYFDAGQGGFEIRTFIAIAGATEGSKGELYYYAPIPIFAVGCTVARMHL